MKLRSEETNEERSEHLTQLTLKCNITIDVNHLSEGFKIALAEERELRSEAVGRDVVFKGASLVSSLPRVLTAHLVRMFYKQASNLDAEGSAGNKAKILRSVTFPERLDMYEFCCDALKAELDPARRDKIEAEELEAMARLKADPRAQLNAEVAAGTKEEADKALEAMKSAAGGAVLEKTVAKRRGMTKRVRRTRAGPPPTPRWWTPTTRRRMPTTRRRTPRAPKRPGWRATARGPPGSTTLSPCSRTRGARRLGALQSWVRNATDRGPSLTTTRRRRRPRRRSSP